MKNIMFALLLLTFACSSKNIPEYTIVENKVYDIPIKSQVTLHVVLNDTTATPEQITDLTELLVKVGSEKKMKYHNGKPTHLFVYVHKTKEAYDSGIWTDCIATYAKIGETDIGKYTYKNSPK